MSKNLALRSPSRRTWLTIGILTVLIFLAKSASKS